jgi:hypothetical protein
MTVDLWRAMIGAIIGIIVFSIFSRVAFGKPSHGAAPQLQGTLTVSRIYAFSSLIVMVGLGIVLIGPWINSPSSFPRYGGIVCIALGLSSVISLMPFFDTTWDSDGLITPATAWGIPLPGKRRFFAWKDLVAVKSDFLGNQCVVDGTGRALRWNFSYRGHRALMRAVAWYRPDLF